MQRPEPTENPYQSPTTISRSIGGVVRSFQVGVEEVTTVVVRSSLWTGLRTHTTDLDGNDGPVQRGPCRFEVGNRERHQVEIEVDRRARVNAYVDGKLIEADMLSHLRTVVYTILAVLGLIGIAVLVLFAVFKFDKVIEQWLGWI